MVGNVGGAHDLECGRDNLWADWGVVGDFYEVTKEPFCAVQSFFCDVDNFLGGSHHLGPGKDDYLLQIARSG